MRILKTILLGGFVVSSLPMDKALLQALNNNYIEVTRSWCVAITPQGRQRAAVEFQQAQESYRQLLHLEPPTAPRCEVFAGVR